MKLRRVVCFLFLVTLWGTNAGAVDRAFVTTTDFMTGNSSSVTVVSGYPTSVNVASIHSDAVARFHDGLVYVVNRLNADNIQILDPSTGYSTVKQFSVGAGSNPHDILVLSSTKAYVTRYDTTDLWIVDPSTGLQTGSISLASLSDIDGFPEMDTMVRVGDRVFVTVQRLDIDNFSLPVGASYVAVIDINTDTLVDVDPVAPGTQSILLNKTNPFSEIALDPYSGKLYVACVGTFGLNDGGVEIIDPVTLQSDGVIFAESAAGGDFGDVEIVAPDKGYAIYSDASFNTILVSFNPQTGVKTGTLFNPGGFVLNDIEPAPDNTLFLADRTTLNPGIRVFDMATDTQITGSPVNVGLPPFDISFNVTVQTGVGDSPPSIATIGQNYPNPFGPSTTIPFTLEQPARVRIAVYDVAGRLVRELLDDRRGVGAQTVRWDGRDVQGRRAPSGVYFVRLKADGFAATQKLILLR